MAKNRVTLGLGGGCHWCTEAIFSSIRGINTVKQGWLASVPPADSFSEGVLLEVDTAVTSLKDIVDIHIETHSSESQHSMRGKYRSAIYVQNEQDRSDIAELIALLNAHDDKKIVTQVLSLVSFKPQPNDDYVDYYFKRPDKPFCQTYISPKLKKLRELSGEHIDKDNI